MTMLESDKGNEKQEPKKSGDSHLTPPLPNEVKEFFKAAAQKDIEDRKATGASLPRLDLANLDSEIAKQAKSSTDASGNVSYSLPETSISNDKTVHSGQEIAKVTQYKDGHTETVSFERSAPGSEPNSVVTKAEKTTTYTYKDGTQTADGTSYSKSTSVEDFQKAGASSDKDSFSLTSDHATTRHDSFLDKTGAEVITRDTTFIQPKAPGQPVGEEVVTTDSKIGKKTTVDYSGPDFATDASGKPLHLQPTEIKVEAKATKDQAAYDTDLVYDRAHNTAKATGHVNGVAFEVEYDVSVDPATGKEKLTRKSATGNGVTFKTPPEEKK